jgi:23S rRNA pseudouridine2604 synthase
LSTFFRDAAAAGEFNLASHARRTAPMTVRRPGATARNTTGAAPAAGSAATHRRRQTHDARPDKNELPRLSKRMSEQGLASRREADEWIAAGWVRVDGEVVDTLGARVRPEQTIEIDPRARRAQADRVTILLHKPVGYVSGQAEDGYRPAVVLVTPENRWRGDRAPIEFNRAQLRGLAVAGRLDIDSTGLLVLTQDGRIARQLIGADSSIEKEYLVRVEWPEAPRADPVKEAFPAERLQLLRHGLALDGVRLKPAKVSWQNENQLRFVLREGRKRQIRRMCEAVGLVVIGLKRVRIGSVVLGALPPGQWRYLRPGEAFG